MKPHLGGSYNLSQDHYVIINSSQQQWTPFCHTFQHWLTVCMRMWQKRKKNIFSPHFTYALSDHDGSYNRTHWCVKLDLSKYRINFVVVWLMAIIRIHGITIHYPCPQLPRFFCSHFCWLAAKTLRMIGSRNIFQ